jgi:hypothetical protein
MTTRDDQPWTVFTGRAAPLADLVQSEAKRRRASRCSVAHEDPKADMLPSDPLATSALPPDDD